MAQQPAGIVLEDNGLLLEKLRNILIYVAEGGVMGRQHAVEYLELRSELLASGLGKILPGFMYQCVTVLRFKEFISLYDPDIILRVAFIDKMIERCGRLGSSVEPARSTLPSAETDPWKF